MPAVPSKLVRLWLVQSVLLRASGWQGDVVCSVR